MLIIATNAHLPTKKVKFSYTMHLMTFTTAFTIFTFLMEKLTRLSKSIIGEAKYIGSF